MPGYISGEVAWRRVRQVVSGAVPAAGASPTLAVPAGHIWRILSVSAQLVTSAAVATRVARLVIADAGSTFLDLPPAATQAASLTTRYAWAPGLVSLNTANGQAAGLPDLTLEPGGIISVTTDLIDVGDQWGALSAYVLDTTVLSGSIALAELPELLVGTADQAP